MKKISEKTAKILLWKPSARLVSVFAFLMLVLLLVPLVRLVPYAVPWYDDYNYGSFARAGMELYGGISGAVRGALNCVRTQWYAWQGTYSSIFFMALMPAVWGEDKYFLGPLFIFALLLTGIFVLVRVLVRDVLRADGVSCLTMQSVTASVVIMFIYTAQAGFYWYNAGIHYVGMHSFAMLFTAALIRLLTARRKRSICLLVFASMLLALLVAGANYVTALQSGLLLGIVGLAGIVWYRRPKRTLLLLPALLVYAAGFYKNVAAPGNGVRARNFEGWGMSPLASVGQSFVKAFQYAGEFTGLITLTVLVLLIPVIWRMVKGCGFRFRYPLPVLACSFCLYASGFTPSLYSLGHEGLSRTLNAVKITWQLLLLLNEVYWLGWLQQYLENKKKKSLGEAAVWWFYPLVGTAMLLIFSFSDNQAGNYSAYGAYYYVHTGEAYNFHEQYLERVEILKSDVSHVVLEPYRFQPWFLCMGDLSDNPDSEENRSVADWYGKASVVVQSREKQE